ncbi:MAG TPA: HU family DNA-binding protein [Ignavibacteria bacterium]|nr:HU family DNA-binding protein [Ignavibacteria bacterium]
MNKYSLINKANKDARISRHLCELVFDYIINQIKDRISEQKYFFADYLGEFSVQRRKMETREDYKLNALVLVPPKDRIVFEFQGDKPEERKEFSGLEIVKSVAGELSISEDKVYEYYISLFREISKAVLKGKNVNIAEFGKFRIKNEKVKFSPARKFAKEINFNFNDLKQSIVKFFEAPEKQEQEIKIPEEKITEPEEKPEEIILPEPEPVLPEPQFIPPVPEFIPPEIIPVTEPEIAPEPETPPAPVRQKEKKTSESAAEPWMKVEPVYIPEYETDSRPIDEPFSVFEDFDFKVEPQVIKERVKEIAEPFITAEPEIPLPAAEPEIPVHEVVTEPPHPVSEPEEFQPVAEREPQQPIVEPVAVANITEEKVIEQPKSLEEELSLEEKLFEEEYKKSEERFEKEREDFENYLSGKGTIPPKIKFESYSKPLEQTEQKSEQLSMPDYSLEDQTAEEKDKLEEKYNETIRKFEEERRKIEEELERLIKSDAPPPVIKPPAPPVKPPEEIKPPINVKPPESDISNLDIWDDDFDLDNLSGNKPKHKNGEKDDEDDFPKSMDDIFSKL